MSLNLLQPRFRWGISSMLTLCVVTLIILLMGLTTALDIRHRRTTANQALEAQGVVLATTLQEILAAPMYFADIDEVNDAARVIRRHPNVTQLEVFAADGRYLTAAEGQTYASGSISDPFALRAISDGAFQQQWDQKDLNVASPVMAGPEAIGGFRFVLDSSSVEREIEAVTIRRLWEALALIALGVVVSYVISLYFVHPIRRLVRATQRVGRGEFAASVQARRSDEIGDLNRAFNSMVAERQRAETALREAHQGLELRVQERTADLVKAKQDLEAGMAERGRLESQLLQVQKMESIGRLAGGVAHDFNNLLTVILGYAQLGNAQLPAEHPVVEHLREVEKAAQRAAGLTGQLLAFSRHQPFEPKAVNLNDLITDTEKMLRRLIGENIELAVLLEPDLPPVNADPGQLQQVLTNLVVNARDATSGNGKITLRTGKVSRDAHRVGQYSSVPPGEYVEFSVTDAGVGMTREVRGHLFEPFFTTKEKGKGTGLGLATCYGIVRRSEGHIEVQSEPGHGTTFSVILPAVSPEAAITPAVGNVNVLPRGRETVLLTEDEPSLRTMVAKVLQEQGYTVLEAGNGDEALRVVEQHRGERIDLLLTDMVMPHMGGVELAERFRKAFPDSRILFTSGYTEQPFNPKSPGMSEVEFIQKPFMLASLVSKVREVLDKAHGAPGTKAKPKALMTAS